MSERSTASRVGLWLLAFCSVLDIASLAMTDGDTPPWAVAVAGAVLGVVSLWLVAHALRNPTSGIRLLAALRTVSALSAVPAFLVDDVPTVAVVAAAVIVVLNVAGVVMAADLGRRPAVSS